MEKGKREHDSTNSLAGGRALNIRIHKPAQQKGFRKKPLPHREMKTEVSQIKVVLDKYHFKKMVGGRTAEMSRLFASPTAYFKSMIGARIRASGQIPLPIRRRGGTEGGVVCLKRKAGRGQGEVSPSRR